MEYENERKKRNTYIVLTNIECIFEKNWEEVKLLILYILLIIITVALRDAYKYVSKHKSPGGNNLQHAVRQMCLLCFSRLISPDRK